MVTYLHLVQRITQAESSNPTCAVLLAMSDKGNREKKKRKKKQEKKKTREKKTKEKKNQRKQTKP